MAVFFVADLTVQGELRQVTEYTYALLEQIDGAIDLIARCSGELWKTPQELEVPITHSGKTQLRWVATAPAAGIATIRQDYGKLISLSLLATGRDKEADATTFAVLQQHLVRELRQTPYEPAFDLMHLAQRPLLATMNFASPDNRAEKMAAALADRCFAAAYFRYHGLA